MKKYYEKIRACFPFFQITKASKESRTHGLHIFTPVSTLSYKDTSTSNTFLTTKQSTNAEGKKNTYYYILQ